MTKTLTFKVSTLVNESTGTHETYSFDGPAKFEGIETKSDIKGKVDIMRIDEGFNAVINNAEAEVNFKCEKCLKSFAKKIKIDSIEKQYLFNEPKKIDDPNDLYLVDKKKMTIDLAEPLRQEIILHFPVFQVCSTHCKGICPKCGTDLNKKKCKCKREDEEIKPLAGLKKLLK